MPIDESSPLLQFPGSNGSQIGVYGDLHDQFCNLSGVPPMNIPTSERGRPHPESLYHRAISHRRHQNAIYMFTASLTNTLLLSQVVLGATLTALGASDSSRILITLFGALNTVIAGLVAFLKSRGQPMRARMFRDDLERVVDEIENSAIMWLGISRGVHGYSAIDTDDQVTVRSEVARLTRLYDRAVKTNTMNDPDMYAAGVITDFHNAALRGGKPGQPALPASTEAAPAAGAAPQETPAPVVPVNDPDESPASKAAMKIAEALKDANDAQDKKSGDLKPAESKPDDSKPDDSTKAGNAITTDGSEHDKADGPALTKQPDATKDSGSKPDTKDADKDAATPKDSMDPGK